MRNNPHFRMNRHHVTDQICVDNRPTGSTQVFRIKARLNIQTVSKLKDLIITDDAHCNEPIKEKPLDDPIHLVFLVDTSDSFNKLDNSSSAAGNVVLEKWVMPFLKQGEFILCYIVYVSCSKPYL